MKEIDGIQILDDIELEEVVGGRATKKKAAAKKKAVAKKKAAVKKKAVA